MKKEIRSVKIALLKLNGEVHNSICDCPAGKSGYCNHVMALLFEIADYSLRQLPIVPDEVACTSQSRKWGLPPINSTNTTKKEAVMDKKIKKKKDSKRVISIIHA